jgi:predicted sulfurtransferase
MKFFKIAAFYSFADLSNLEELQVMFTSFLKNEDIKGTVLIAHEGDQWNSCRQRAKH